MTAPRLLTRRDFAAWLRVSTRTLDRLRAGGQIPDPLAGPGLPRWDADDVAAWLKAGRPAADAWRRLRARRR